MTHHTKVVGAVNLRVQFRRKALAVVCYPRVEELWIDIGVVAYECEFTTGLDIRVYAELFAVECRHDDVRLVHLHRTDVIIIGCWNGIRTEDKSS